MNNLKEFQEKIGIKFSNLKILKTALTHSSYTNETNEENNERLEFLGDSLIGLFVGDYFYRNYDISEGVMTKKRAQAVCEDALFYYGKKIDLGQYLFLGKGEEISGGRNQKAIIADAFEALIAAVYLDRGFKNAKLFFEKNVLPYIHDTFIIKDYKSELQELVQSDKRSISYEIIKEYGPAHKKVFVSEVKMEDISLGIGKGNTKKEAEQNAAHIALKKLAKNNN